MFTNSLNIRIYQPRAQSHVVCMLLLLSCQHSSLVTQAAGTGMNYCLGYQPFCECKSIEKIECRNVRDLARLFFFRSRTDIANYKRIDYMSLEAATTTATTSPPGQSDSGGVLLNSSLQLDGLVFDSSRFQFILSNFAGLELEHGLFSRAQLANGLFNRLVLSNVTLKFLYRGKTEFDWICDLVVDDKNLRPLFSSFK